MKNSNYVSQKTFTLLLQISITCALMISSSVGQSICPNQNRLFDDTQKLLAKIKKGLGRDVADNQDGFRVMQASLRQDTSSFDDIFHMVDRSQQELKGLNAVGVITGGSYEPGQTDLMYGSATLISPCFVLTNKHVMRDIGKTAKGDVANFSVGQPLSCNTGDEFQNMNVAASLVAAGEGPLVEGDWAILKVDQSKILSVTPAKISDTPLKTNDPVLLGGFPDSHFGKEGAGFSRLWANQTRVSKFSLNGTIQTLEKNNQHGLSAAGAFKIDTDPNGALFAKLAGIRVSKGIIIKLQTILTELKSTNDDVYQSLQRSIRTGRCE